MSLSQLKKYLPQNSYDYVTKLIEPHRLTIKITNPRRTRLGSFRSNGKNRAATINISGSLNPYSFLLTLVHELAHLKVHEAYGIKATPHGKEWKAIFTHLMKPLLNKKVFPDPELLQALTAYFQNPKAASSSDIRLAKALKKHDPGKEETLTVEDLPDASFFIWQDGRVFQKEKKLRTRYRCIEKKTGKIYLFNALAEVLPLEQ